MSLFFTSFEMERLKNAAPDSRQAQLYRALRERTLRNTAADCWVQPTDTQEWYHLCWERMMDASFVYAVEQNEAVGKWVYSRTMETVRMDLDKWIGPFYRPRNPEDPYGALESAHITLAVCEAYENAAGLFSESEKEEIRTALREKGLRLCKRFCERVLAGQLFTNNWLMVLMNGYGTAAVVLNDKAEIDRAVEIAEYSARMYNTDSYGETVQYSNYASITLSHLNEVLIRSGHRTAEELNLDCYANLMRWYAYSYLYQKPIESIGGVAPRTVNFGDSGATFRPSGDTLAQIAVRMKDNAPQNAALATWLFEQTYANPEIGPDELATFGFFNQFEYFTVLMQPDMVAPQSPEELDLPLSARFDCGHIISRDRWNEPNTTIAIAAGYDPYNVTSHRHLDQNSFQLIVGNERIFTDPGHCCYRLNAQRRSVDELTHNCISIEKGYSDTAEFVETHTQAQNPTAGRELIPQKGVSGSFFAPTEPMNKLLYNEFFGDVQVIASDATALYGAPLNKVVRIWAITMPDMIFVADVVCSDKPVSLWSHFSINNRNNELHTHVYNNHRLVFRRSGKGIKLFEAASYADGEAVPSELFYEWGYMHDYYHPLPNQAGQGKEGSALIYNWRCPKHALEHLRIHTIAIAGSTTIPGYHMHNLEDGFVRLEAPDHSNWVDFALTKDSFTVRRAGIGERTFSI